MSRINFWIYLHICFMIFIKSANCLFCKINTIRPIYLNRKLLFLEKIKKIVSEFRIGCLHVMIKILLHMQEIQKGHLDEVCLSPLPGNLRPCLVLPRLIHLCDLKSKNSTIFKLGSASEAPPATMTPSRPLTRALTQECWKQE